VITYQDLVRWIRGEVADGADPLPTLYLHVSDGHGLRPPGQLFGFCTNEERAQLIRTEIESTGDSCMVLKCDLVPRELDA